ncbi:antibiotic biosynthesis monooxygenase [Marinobacter sp. R17]|uniref:antibiotic biosynthesis monooxygenase family protein n=1 Tax=Marinobacter TaxID=2742 RepID=UPI000F4D1EBA|nr:MULTISPECIES: antibiotic biosynthesis monooxygenase [Marinobacter]ROU01631.1 antibiotic biosynthesis monooxygenase [Marinobacter sp. R17]
MIRVLIERHIATTLESAYERESRLLLQHAVSVPGFISGETLVDANDIHHRMTLCNWRSITDWDNWYHSDQRKEMMNELNLMMDQEEKVTILQQC